MNRCSYTYVYNSLINNGQNVETAQVITNRLLINRLRYIHTMEYYLLLERESDIGFTVEEPCHCTKWPAKPATKGETYESTWVKFLDESDSGTEKVISQDQRKEEMSTQWAPSFSFAGNRWCRWLQNSENIFNDMNCTVNMVKLWVCIFIAILIEKISNSYPFIWK